MDDVLESHGLKFMCRVVTRRDRHPSGERSVFLVKHMRPTVKVCESVGRCTTPAMKPRKTCYPQKTKVIYRRLSNELNSKKKIFYFEMEVFIHGICMCKGVSEGSGHSHDIRTFM